MAHIESLREADGKLLRGFLVFSFGTLNESVFEETTVMMRWSVLMLLSIASVCCLAATIADDKEKAAESTKKAEKQVTEKKETAKKEGDKKEGDKKEGEDGEKKFTAKCPVSGEAAKENEFTAYKEKQVYFCCEKCKAAFEAEPTKFEVKANHQLVQTKQFVQKKCPISGADFKKEESARVSNVMVRFCCEKCKGQVQSAEAAEKLEMIFAEKPFKKAFVAAKAKSEDGDTKEKPKAEKKKSDKSKEETTEKATSEKKS